MSVLDHPQWWVLNLFRTTLNKHPYCGVKYMSAYGECWLWKHLLSLYFLLVLFNKS